jgi:hypothetical protein
MRRSCLCRGRGRLGFQGTWDPDAAELDRRSFEDATLRASRRGIRATASPSDVGMNRNVVGLRMTVVMNRSLLADAPRYASCAALDEPMWGTGPGMRIMKLAWVGTRTDNAEPTVAFLRDVLGLRLELEQPGFWMLKLPDGSKVEVFGPIVRSTGISPPARSRGSWSTTSRTRPPSCGPPVSRPSLSRGSTTAGTPGCTSEPRTATSMSSPRTLASPDHTRHRS